MRDTEEIIQSPQGEAYSRHSWHQFPPAMSHRIPRQDYCAYPTATVGVTQPSKGGNIDDKVLISVLSCSQAADRRLKSGGGSEEGEGS